MRFPQTMEDTNRDPIFIAQADLDKRLEEKFKAANQKLEDIQKVHRLPMGLVKRWRSRFIDQDSFNFLSICRDS